MRAVRLLPLLLVLAACASDPLGVAARTVEVRASVSASDARALDFEVANRGRRTVHVAACDQRIVPTVQRRDQWDQESANDFSVFCLGIYSMIPVAVEPGESARGTAQVPGAGEFRVVVVLRDPDDAEQQTHVASEGVIVAP